MIQDKLKYFIEVPSRINHNNSWLGCLYISVCKRRVWWVSINMEYQRGYDPIEYPSRVKEQPVDSKNVGSIKQQKQ